MLYVQIDMHSAGAFIQAFYNLQMRYTKTIIDIGGVNVLTKAW